MLGKKVVNNVYWHTSLTPEQAPEVQANIAEAERLADVEADIDYNVIKYDLNSQSLSLLYYLDFFDSPFPVLNKSYRIDLDKQRVEKRSYESSLNPPILHRKELLLSEQHPRVSGYKELTATAEQLGLFDNPIAIGFKQAWENLIAEKGFQLIDGEFLPIGNQEGDEEYAPEITPTISRHKNSAIAPSPIRGCRKSQNRSFSLREKVRMRAYKKQLVATFYPPLPDPLPQGEGAFTTPSIMGEGWDEGSNKRILAYQHPDPISRHLTALSRSNLSAPMQCLARHGFLDGSLSVFDYGCGKGDDIRNLSANDIPVAGWDPHYAPDQPKQSADIVNLGFVINVIENIQERLEALLGAYELTQQLLVVSAMLFNQNALKGQAFNDGVITQRNTFQKYFTQTELKEFLSDTLDTDAIPVAPGIFFVFKDKDAEQRFLLDRQRSRRNLLRLTQRPSSPTEPKLSRNEKKYQTYQHLLDPLWQQSLELGRLPEKTEIDALVELTAAFGTANKALRFMLNQFDAGMLEQARLSRIDDLLTYFALQTFSKRKAYKHLDATLQKDIKAFFGDYKEALAQAQTVLFQIGNAELIETNCRQATEQGLGYLDDENALHLHTRVVQQLPAVLRIYIGCATLLYGDIEQTDLIKIHSQSGKLSLMRYDDFENQPLPRLLERVKINLRAQTFDLYQYGDEFEPTYLYLKSRYINEEFPYYAEQLNFDEQLQALNCFDLSGYGPKPEAFQQTLEQHRWEIGDFELIRSCSLPELDSPCGDYLTYRQLIECGETQHKSGLPNLPKQADSYTALYELTTNILDPVIDYFGMIRLSYGFCSHELGRLIKKRVAPKLDQHAAHELNTRKNLICPRLGAAVDFIVEDEDMREVAAWIAENTPFDRLYFYGKDRPIHVSYGPEQKREYIDMVTTESGKQVPRKKSIHRKYS